MKTADVDTLGNRRRATDCNGTIRIDFFNRKGSLEGIKFFFNVRFSNIDGFSNGIVMWNARFIFLLIVVFNLAAASSGNVFPIC